MDETLKKLQQTQLEIMKVVDNFCRENKIQYSLYAGTLLGAVRHKGFIPWDDDLDICMSRKHYNRFIKLWKKHHPSGYLLQNKDNTPGFTQSFTKIRKEHTTFLQPVDLPELYHVGIFIDIFPSDKMPNGKISRTLFKINCIFYQLYTKGYIPHAANIIERIISRCALTVVPKKKYNAVRKHFYKQIIKYNKDDSLCTVFNESMSTINTPLPSRLMDAFVDMDFEDSKFQCMKDWDVYLTLKFGDYMTPPPEKERISIHNAQIIDFEHDYEEHMRLEEMNIE